jgi:hypothetical protein
VLAKNNEVGEDADFGVAGDDWVMLKLKFLMDWDWRRLVSSPIDCNEYPKLKLLRAWEPSDNSRTSLLGERKETLNSFFDGD